MSKSQILKRNVGWRKSGDVTHLRQMTEFSNWKWKKPDYFRQPAHSNTHKYNVIFPIKNPSLTSCNNNNNNNKNNKRKQKTTDA